MISAIEAPCSPAFPFGQPHAMPFSYGFTFYSDMPGQIHPTLHADTSITLRKAIEEVLIAKQNAGLRKHTIETMRSVLNNFAKGREDMPLRQVNVRTVEDWILGLKVKPWTKLSNIGRLSSLFSYHVRRENISSNPCRKLERIKVDFHAPVVLSPDQAEQLIKRTPMKLRAYVTLGLFAGVRPEETQKITWEDICFETKTVRVNLTKTRRRRIVPLEPRAVSLLQSCTRKQGKIAPSASTIGRFKSEAAKAIGFDQWPQDLLRHTAASYLLALIDDAGKVAARLGNSSSVLLTHYHQPVTKSDCEKFWTVTPPPRPFPPYRAKRKYSYTEVRRFYNECDCFARYKLTMEKFGITNSATLHYILNKT